MPPPWLEGSSSADEWLYDVVRGRCPRCDSGAVGHLIIGEPVYPDALGATPDWVCWVGCVHPGYNRSCEACGLTWTSGPDGTGVLLPHLHALKSIAGVDSGEALGEWVSSKMDIDAYVDHDGQMDVIRMSTRGMGLDFPMSLDDFWILMQDLRAIVLELWDREETDD